jgi:hypothetical protein
MRFVDVAEADTVADNVDDGRTSDDTTQCGH